MYGIIISQKLSLIGGLINEKNSIYCQIICLWNDFCYNYYVDTIMEKQKELKVVEVVAAIIIKDGKLFATQRGYGEWKDWWEFPGGKIEPGEDAVAALRREIKEELEAEVEVVHHLCTVEYDYEKFHLSMQCFHCRPLSDAFSLLEHEDARWLDKNSVNTVKWLPADIGIIPQILPLLEG